MQSDCDECNGTGFTVVEGERERCPDCGGEDKPQLSREEILDRLKKITRYSAFNNQHADDGYVEWSERDEVAVVTAADLERLIAEAN
tara:strand:+ start:160 stop:420 length:261 start_codon:yes stop_codon:yes gene_type:complete